MDDTERLERQYWAENNTEKLREENAETETVAKMALQKANQNEQYSRKNNVKIMNIKEDDGEDEHILMNAVYSLPGDHNVRLEPT